MLGALCSQKKESYTSPTPQCYESYSSNCGCQALDVMPGTCKTVDGLNQHVHSTTVLSKEGTGVGGARGGWEVKVPHCLLIMFF